MKKRIFAAVCVVVMLLAMSTAVFAAPSIGTMGYSPNAWTRWNNARGCLTPGASTGSGNTVLSSPISSVNIAQLWSLRRQPNDGSYRMYNNVSYNATTGRGYTLNIRSGMCTTLYDNPSNRSDSEVDLNTINASQNLYRIKLPYYNVYLQSRGSKAQCSWEYYNETSAYQKWTARA